jgi:hypothetical protein
MHDKVTVWSRLLCKWGQTNGHKPKPRHIVSHDVVDIFSKLTKNISMHDKVAVRTQMCVLIKSNCDEVKLLNVSVTLTFEVVT